MTDTTTTAASESRSRRGERRSFLRRHGPLLLAAGLFIVGMVLGYFGFREHAIIHSEPRSFLDILYMTLQLFTLESGAVDPPLPPALEWARYIAPLATLVTVLVAAFALFRDELRPWWIWWWYRGHVVICGLGRKGLQLVEDSRRLGDLVVVIEPDAQNDHIPLCRELGAIVLVADPRSETVLRMAKIARARYAVIVCDDDGVNIDASVSSHRLAGEPRGGSWDYLTDAFDRLIGREPCSKVRCFVEVFDLRMCRLLREHEDFNQDETPFELSLFNTYENAARQLFDAHPLDGDGIRKEDDPTVIHVIVIGFGWMGQSVVLQAAKLGQYANRKKLRVTIVDSQIEERRKDFLRRHPYFEETCDPQYVPAAAEDTQHPNYRAALTPEKDVETTVVICLDNETDGFLCAMHLVPQLEDDRARVFLRATEGEFVRVLMSITCTAEDEPSEVRAARRVSPFGMVEECCSRGTVINEQQDCLAKAMHERYVEKEKAKREQQLPSSPGTLHQARDDVPATSQPTQTQEPRPTDELRRSMKPWPRLAHDFRESNRQAADHIPVKLRAIGCSFAKEQQSEKVVAAFDEEEIELLAEMEHNRWRAERYLAGWTKGPDDARRKTNPRLVPWEELDDATKKENRKQVAEIPGLLREHLGQAIYRRADPKPPGQSQPTTESSSAAGIEASFKR
jgi:hypothetical protein